MRPLSSFFTFLFVAIWILQLVWAGRIWKLGFARRYPVLLTYLVTSSVLGVGLRVLGAVYTPPTTDSAHWIVYYWAWVATKPFYWTLLFCVLVEIHNHTLQTFRGFQRLGQLFIWLSLSLVGCLFLAMSWLGPARASIRRFLETQQLGIFLALTLFSALLIVFAAYFRLEVSENARVIYGVVAISVASATIFRALGDMGLLRNIGSVSSTRINSIVYLGCLAVGVLRFSAAGAGNSGVVEFPAARWTDAGRDVAQGLENLNRQLVRILRS